MKFYSSEKSSTPAFQVDPKVLRAREAIIQWMHNSIAKNPHLNDFYCKMAAEMGLATIENDGTPQEVRSHVDWLIEMIEKDPQQSDSHCEIAGMRIATINILSQQQNTEDDDNDTQFQPK